MKQYCRYCGSCHEVDGGFYCNEKEQLMTESKIKRANNCKHYGYTDVGDVITGKQYQPREPYKKHDKQPPQGKQMSLEEIEVKKCHDKDCIFHEGTDLCIIPENENLCYCVNGVVDSCINRVYDERDLSKEGKEKLQRLKNKQL